jgi:hypothetical protein
MSKVKVIEPMGGDVEAAALLELSRQRFEAFKRRGAPGRTATAGQFVVPPGYESWAFYRCGKRPQPGMLGMSREVAVALATYEACKQMGFVDAPADTKWDTGNGLETTADALYVCIPRVHHEEVSAILTQAKRQALAEEQSGTVRGLQGAIQKQFPGVRYDLHEEQFAHQVPVIDD